MLALIGAAILGFAVFYVMFSIQTAAARVSAEERLKIEVDTDNTIKELPIYIKLAKPFLRGYYLDLAAQYWKAPAIGAWKQKLTTAGLIRFVQPEHFVAAKFWLAVVTVILLVINHLFSAEPPSVVVAIAIAGGVFYMPNLHLQGAIAQRQQEIRLALPYVIDLLTLSTEAGLDFMGSIGKVVDRSPPSPLVDELSQVLKDIQLGKTRAEAMRDMGRRLNMQEITSLVAVIVSADQMGASIGAVLRAQTDLMRTTRINKAEKLAAQASQKILFPLILFIMPAVILMIFGPVILDFMGVGK